MICLAKFKQILEHLEDKDRKIDAFSEVFGTSEKVLDLLDHDEVVKLLEEVFDDQEEIIPYWIWELNYGHDWKPGYVTDVNGNDIKLEAAEDLYNYLTQKETSAEGETVFSVPSQWGSSDFELTYHPNTGTYTMSMETIYQMDTVNAYRYLTDIAEQFTEWMNSNNYYTDKRLNLWEVFTNGLNFNSDFASVEDAYAAFEMLICGSSAQGIEGLSYEKE